MRYTTSMAESSSDDEKIDRLRRAMYSRSLSPKLTPRPRRDMEEGPAVVGEDWRREEPKMPIVMTAPRSLRSGKHALMWLLIVSVVFFVGAAGFLAYYFTIGGGSVAVAPGNISISISGPPAVPGGESTELQISVSNQNRASLELADLIITYPPGTRLSSNMPVDVPNQRQRVPLGSISSGEIRQMPVRAVFSGEEGSRSNLKVELEYRLEGSSAVFVAESNYEIIFSSSPLSISIDGNRETVSGQPIELTFTVNSNASSAIRDVLLSVSYPFGFTFGDSDPSAYRQEAKASSGVWTLGDITPGESVRVVLRGTLNGESNDERIFRATIGTRETPQSRDIDTALADNSYKVVISGPFLGLGISVNKITDSSVIVRPGDTVNVSIAWQNNLSTPVTDAVIVARLSGLEIDGEKVRTTGGFYRSSDSAVLLDKNTTGGILANLASGSSGSVDFSFIVPDSDALQSIKNPRLSISVNAAGKRISETDVPENLQATTLKTIKVASSLEILAQGFYYQNPFGSEGPLPPKAGSETTYAIALGVTNTTSKITNAKLTAILPPYVRWLGKYLPSSSESVTYNKSDGSITWNIGDISSGVGVEGVPPRQIAFAIGFTPSTSQIGEKPALLQNIVLTGIDSATGESISPQAADVTTNILGDQGFSSSYATVVR